VNFLVASHDKKPHLIIGIGRRVLDTALPAGYVAMDSDQGRQMKKYAAIVGLALLLIGIAYVRAIFSHQDHSGGIPNEVETAIPADILEDYVMKEEAASRLDSIQCLYVDSLDKMRALVSASADGRQATDSLDSVINALSQKLDSAENDARRATTEKDALFEKLIAGFYQGEMERLPADLSRYEHEVSVKEIRDKAMKYFGVTSEKLDRIIKKYR